MKTILAIAISAAFCYSSYALAELPDDYDADAEVKESLKVLQTPIATWINACQQVVSGDENPGYESAEECVERIYTNAAAQLQTASPTGKDTRRGTTQQTVLPSPARSSHSSHTDEPLWAKRPPGRL